MTKRTRAWVAAGVLALSGCTNGVIGSCTFASGAACVDYLTQTGGTPASVSCTDTLAGTWAEASACPTSGRVGRCNTENRNGTAMVSYYAPFSSEEARTDCAGIEGGTFQED